MQVWEAICICRSAGGRKVSEVTSAWIFYDEKTDNRNFWEGTVLISTLRLPNFLLCVKKMEPKFNGVQDTESTSLKVAHWELFRNSEKRLRSE